MITVIFVAVALKLTFGVEIPPNETEFSPKKLLPLIEIVVPTRALLVLKEVMIGRGTICVCRTLLAPATPALFATKAAFM